MPTDLNQRQRALDPARSFVVQAPAGSGKTEVLTQRFLRLLATVSRPERLLAITFTRKATQEMRARISKRLAQAERGDQPDKAHDRQAVALAQKVLERDREKGWNLLHNPGRLRITTIDGLCMQLLTRDPVHGPRWTGVRVLENARPLRREAVRRFFADIDELAANASEDSAAQRAQDALVSLLVHLGGDARRLETLLMDMLDRRSLWRRHLETDRERLDALLRDRQLITLEAFTDALGAQALREARELAAALGLRAPEAAQDPASQLRSLVAFARHLSTAANQPRKPGGVSRKLFPDMDDAQAPQLERLREIYTTWHENPKALDALERMASWPPLDTPDDPDSRSAGAPPDLPADILDQARSVLALVLVEFNALMAETGEADFTAITDAALESLGSETEPAPSLLAEDARIEHILMDEFQDTSHTQFELLLRLTAGWQAGDGRSLFLVGDPMQSIYRFREAHVGFFNEVVRRGRLGQVAVEALALTSNFRSQRELIEWFNATFPGVFPARDESDSGAVSYTPVDPERGEGGVVQLHARRADQEQAGQGAQVLNLVREALDDPANESIAVLVRSRPRVGEITAALSGAGIAFEAVCMEGLTGRPVIRDLRILTRALAHPMDRVAWIALLRAPWCGLPVGEIHTVLGDLDMPVADAIAEAVREARLSGDSEARLQRVNEVMTRARAAAGRHPLAVLVEWCWLRLGGHGCCAGAADLEDAETFLELLEEVEQSGGHEIVERLEETLEERYAASRPARVQVMTIHNAKGLEFDVVVIPDLHRRSGSPDTPLVALQEFLDGDKRSGVLMAPITPKYVMDTSLYRYLCRVSAERERFENQRVLYVACTRARRALHLVADIKPSARGKPLIPSNTFLAFLDAPFRRVLDQLFQGGNGDPPFEREDEVEPGAIPLLRLCGPLPVVFSDLLSEPEPVNGGDEKSAIRLRELPDREAVALGSVLHRWLELIHDHPEPAWDIERVERAAPAMRTSLARAGAPRNRLDALQARCIGVLGRSLAQGNLAERLVRRDDGHSWSELPLLRRDAGGFSRHVIDLLVEEGDGALRIVDYKSGFGGGSGGEFERNPARGDLQTTESDGKEEAWQRQLERYRELVRRLSGADQVEAEIIRLENEAEAASEE